jgi:cytochrome c biogenesis protein CcmG/thiol:disulfide interchange protein DsbE
MSARLRLGVLIGTGLMLGVLLGILIMKPSSLIRISAKFQRPVSVYLQTGAAAIGKPAPDFTISGLGNSEIQLSKYVGYPVVLNFWASWCIPCQVEMPYLQQRYQSLNSRLAVIGVNAGESKSDVQKFVDDFGLTFDIGLDARGAVQKKYIVVGLPVTYFIDEQGVVRAEHIGEMSEEQLNGYLALLGVQN